ncbi:hypothetical protein HGM15179_022290 [Zosterops borbonicus]|uniref:Interleukin-23 subunit alpha n=1 Tax=Zosterops borbonicus TaxID=364589 RepID=A0A8K1D462_9PASS|nr:hypothetical protein HGM15179_022290 [Zosterops borbonicus]
MQLLEEPQNWPPRIRCSDACDPLALETNNTEGHGRTPRHPLPPTQLWQRQIQRHLALKRLRSFAAVMSRVFNHSAR